MHPKIIIKATKEQCIILWPLIEELDKINQVTGGKGLIIGQLHFVEPGVMKIAFGVLTPEVGRQVIAIVDHPTPPPPADIPEKAS